MNKKLIKKIMPYLLITSLSASLAACGNDEDKTADNKAVTEAVTTEITTEAVTTEATTSQTTTAATTAKTTKKTDKPKKTEKPTEEETTEPEEEEIEEEEEEVVSSGSFDASDLYVYYGGYSLTINQDMSTFFEASSVDSSPSCYYDGDDKIFHYGDMDVYTYPYGDSDLVLEISVLSGNVTTAKGLSVGMTLDDAIAMYGQGSDGGGVYSWYSGSTYMYVTTSGGVITSIGMALQN